MIRRTSTILLVSLLLVASMAMIAFAAQSKGRNDMQVHKASRIAFTTLAYSFAALLTLLPSTTAKIGRKIKMRTAANSWRDQSLQGPTLNCMERYLCPTNGSLPSS